MTAAAAAKRLIRRGDLTVFTTGHVSARAIIVIMSWIRREQGMQPPVSTCKTQIIVAKRECLLHIIAYCHMGQLIPKMCLRIAWQFRCEATIEAERNRETDKQKERERCHLPYHF